MEEILKTFTFDGNAVSTERYGSGHINSTFLVVTDSGKKYILQKINNKIFPDVAGLMNNIMLVTEHLKKKYSDERRVLSVVPTVDGKSFAKVNGEYWRAYNFVEDSLCLQLPENNDDFYESAVAFGTFGQDLSDFPVEKLVEVIPDFHNTPDRFKKFHEVLEKDPLGRAAGVQEEIKFCLDREEEMGTLQRLRNEKVLPDRVTHNDTKLNNVLLDKDTRKSLCVIDLDTVMPGLCLYDYGDSIRFGASTAVEDEKDLSKVSLSLELFEIYTKGFLKSCPYLTDKEIEYLPMGAKTMTFECGMRFLTDYIDGDNYFAVHREGHNLDRARTQFKLVSDMETKWDLMKEIVDNGSI
ncbi:MAG: phosphotransferase enzyme family protein [Catonella sp.]|uniref:phosphotransferase enzyme family protein n=1 Tax=Catonella sp. TaxID=2382125 RepID=UPI003FA1588F